MRWIWFCLMMLANPAMAQLKTDTLFTWQGYASESFCRVRWFVSGEKAGKPHTIVVEEQAENSGPTTLADLSYLAELIGRQLGIDPVEILWVVHWGNFSFKDAARRPKKELFLRATFRRTTTGRLSAPQWKVISRTEMAVFTNRWFE